MSYELRLYRPKSDSIVRESFSDRAYEYLLENYKGALSVLDRLSVCTTGFGLYIFRIS